MGVELIRCGILDKLITGEDDGATISFEEEKPIRGPKSEVEMTAALFLCDIRERLLMGEDGSVTSSTDSTEL